MTEGDITSSIISWLQAGTGIAELIALEMSKQVTQLSAANFRVTCCPCKLFIC